jgi:hypothetical protein
MTGATLAPRLSASGASLRLMNHEGKAPKGRTAVEQALDIWPVLVECATNAGSHADEAKISYGDLALSIGYPRKKAARSVRRALQLVGWYCIGTMRLRSIPLSSSKAPRRLANRLSFMMG